MTSEDYTLIHSLEDLIDSVQPDSIVSRTFYRDDNMKAIAFAFDAGQELSEHTSNHAAIIQIVKGDAVVTLGDDRHELKAGSWIHMQPRLKHSITASTPLIMLLLMFETD